MAKIGPYEVTEEKLQDIYAGRARLTAFKATIEKYGPWPEEEALTFEREGQASTLNVDNPKAKNPISVDSRLDQLQSITIATRDTLLDHIKAKGKGKSKYD